MACRGPTGAGFTPKPAGGGCVSVHSFSIPPALSGQRSVLRHRVARLCVHISLYQTLLTPLVARGRAFLPRWSTAERRDWQLQRDAKDVKKKKKAAGCCTKPRKALRFVRLQRQIWCEMGHSSSPAPSVKAATLARVSQDPAAPFNTCVQEVGSRLSVSVGSPRHLSVF